MTFWRKISNTLNLARPGGGCHGEGVQTAGDGLRKVGIVGSPNVGKSVVFNSLTGAYVTVSNYPGTTVDVSKGKAKVEGEEIEVIDTPGMYSLLPITEEERVARLILFEEELGAVLHVVDTRNMESMLPLTLQLMEAGYISLTDNRISLTDKGRPVARNVVRRQETSTG